MEKRVAVEGRNGSLSVEFGGRRWRSWPGCKVKPGRVLVALEGRRLSVKQGKVEELFLAANKLATPE